MHMHTRGFSSDGMYTPATKVMGPCHVFRCVLQPDVHAKHMQWHKSATSMHAEKARKVYVCQHATRQHNAHSSFQVAVVHQVGLDGSHGQLCLDDVTKIYRRGEAEDSAPDTRSLDLPHTSSVIVCSLRTTVPLSNSLVFEPVEGAVN